METAPASILYESVASDITALIDSGTLGPGERVPSVRRLSRQKHVSISTVLQAYRCAREPRHDRGAPAVGLLRPLPRPRGRRAGDHQSAALAEPRWRARPGEPRPCRWQRSPRGSAGRGASGTRADAGREAAAHAVRDRTPPPRIADHLPVPPGREELRRQIARRALDWGCNLTAGDVIVTTGCMEALNLCLRAVAKAGDIIALESPTYFGVLQVIESLGMKALEIPTHPREGISLEALSLACERERVKACLLMCNVSNPLGSVMPDIAKKRLVQMLAEHGIPLIEDLVYGDLYFRAHATARGQGLRQAGHGDAVLVVLEDAGAGLPRRLGRARTLSCAGGKAEVRELGRQPGAAAAYSGRVSRERRLRPPAAIAAPGVRRPYRAHPARRVRAFSRGHARDAARPAASCCGWSCREASIRSRSTKPRCAKASALLPGRCFPPRTATAIAYG